MSTLPPNITKIIKAEVERRIKAEVDKMEQKIVKDLHERMPEIIAKVAVDVALENGLMELGNIIRFDIRA